MKVYFILSLPKKKLSQLKTAFFHFSMNTNKKNVYSSKDNRGINVRFKFKTSNCL